MIVLILGVFVCWVKLPRGILCTGQEGMCGVAVGSDPFGLQILPDQKQIGFLKAVCLELPAAATEKVHVQPPGVTRIPRRPNSTLVIHARSPVFRVGPAAWDAMKGEPQHQNAVEVGSATEPTCGPHRRGSGGKSSSILLFAG